MNGITLAPGLHVCTSVSRTPEGNLEGVECDRDTYSSMDVLYACVVGRPTTANREILFYLNGSIVDKAEDTQSPNMVYYHPIDERFLGLFRIVYQENGCEYWQKEFSMGVCPTAAIKPPIDVLHLTDLLRKFRV